MLNVWCWNANSHIYSNSKEIFHSAWVELEVATRRDASAFTKEEMLYTHQISEKDYLFRTACAHPTNDIRGSLLIESTRSNVNNQGGCTGSVVCDNIFYSSRKTLMQRARNLDQAHKSKERTNANELAERGGLLYWLDASAVDILFSRRTLRPHMSDLALMETFIRRCRRLWGPMNTHTPPGGKKRHWLYRWQ